MPQGVEHAQGVEQEGPVPSFDVTLLTPQGEVRLRCATGEFVLHAALAQGLDLPYTCLQGWCITCAGKLLRGEVDQSASLRYFPEDREAGFVLPCTARPRSDLTIVTHQKEALRAHRVAQGLPVPRG
jgi:ferredoxin